MAEPELETKCIDVSTGDLDITPGGVLVGSGKEDLGFFSYAISKSTSGEAVYLMPILNISSPRSPPLPSLPSYFKVYFYKFLPGISCLRRNLGS